MNTPNHWPSAEDVMQYLHRNRGSAAHADLLSGLALFGTGLLFGAGLALLFAPSSGEDLRHDLGERFNDLQERVAGDDDTPERNPSA